jgi:murein DD-endopeptidase MepM/ murein hydrolase activator NlpD
MHALDSLTAAAGRARAHASPAARLGVTLAGAVLCAVVATATLRGPQPPDPAAFSLNLGAHSVTDDHAAGTLLQGATAAEVDAALVSARAPSPDALPVDAVDVALAASAPAPVTAAATSRLGVAAGGAVELIVPSRNVVGVGFHEASNPDAYTLSDDEAGGVVLDSRGRSSGPRSAADVRVEPDTPIQVPVAGVVIEAVDYMLYGKYADSRVRIRPDARPDLVVSVLHVRGLRLQAGQHVNAGDPLAEAATQFPFESQVDRTFGRGPHVHVELVEYRSDMCKPRRCWEP